MTKKVMITVRLDPSQFNEVLVAAAASKLSMNEYCLRQIGVTNVKREVKGRGRFKGVALSVEVQRLDSGLEDNRKTLKQGQFTC